jgi:hypothetical protein
MPAPSRYTPTSKLELWQALPTLESTGEKDPVAVARWKLLTDEVCLATSWRTACVVTAGAHPPPMLLLHVLALWELHDSCIDTRDRVGRGPHCCCCAGTTWRIAMPTARA